MARAQTAGITTRSGASTASILRKRLRMVSTISARLAQCSDLSARMDDALAETGTMVGADCADLFQFKQGSTLLDNTNKWRAPEVAALDGLPFESLSWMSERVRRGETLQINDVRSLPPGGRSLRSILEVLGIRSLLVFPMGPVGRPTGFLTFAYVRKTGAWRPEDIDLLQLVSQLMSDALERQQARRGLELSLRRQSAILENIPDIAWLKDVDSRFVHVNEPFAGSCGVPAEELIGKTDLDIWPRDLATRYRHDDAEVMRRRKRMRVEEPLADKDLGERIIETIKTPVFDSNGQILGTTGIARDVTERWLAELVIRDSEDRHRRLVESLPAILYRYSQRKGASYWSPQVKQILGFSQQDLREKPFLWHDAIHPDDLPMVDNAIAAFCGRQPNWQSSPPTWISISPITIPRRKRCLAWLRKRLSGKLYLKCAPSTTWT